MTSTPVQESIQEIDDNSWLVGGKLLLTRATPPSENAWGYTIEPAPHPLPESRPLHQDSKDIKLVYDAGDVSAVYSIGSNAFCKVRILNIPQTTREHVTLTWMHQRTWSFLIPETLHHAEFDGRYYHFITRVPGTTLDSVWPRLDDAQRQRLVERIVSICAELAVPAAPGTTITGVDGGFLTEQYMCGRHVDCSPENLTKNALAMGMDCSALAFYHCDLGPTNIVVDQETNCIGIIDWETAGYVPKEWIRTKFRVSSGMNLSSGDAVDWRKRVMLRMGELGYVDVVDAFSNHA